MTDVLEVHRYSSAGDGRMYRSSTTRYSVTPPQLRSRTLVYPNPVKVAQFTAETEERDRRREAWLALPWWKRVVTGP